jgi:hypothetical protein
MSSEATTVTELRREVERLRTRLAEVEETLQALRGNEEILAAERLARSILDNATEAIVVCDRTGSVLRTSRAARRLCSSDPHGRSFAAVFPLQYAPGAAADPPDLVSATLAGRLLRGVEAALVGPGGESQLKSSMTKSTENFNQRLHSILAVHAYWRPGGRIPWMIRNEVVHGKSQSTESGRCPAMGTIYIVQVRRRSSRAQEIRLGCADGWLRCGPVSQH